MFTLFLSDFGAEAATLPGNHLTGGWMERIINTLWRGFWIALWRVRRFIDGTHDGPPADYLMALIIVLMMMVVTIITM